MLAAPPDVGADGRGGPVDSGAQAVLVEQSRRKAAHAAGEFRKARSGLDHSGCAIGNQNRSRGTQTDDRQGKIDLVDILTCAERHAGTDDPGQIADWGQGYRGVTVRTGPASPP